MIRLNIDGREITANAGQTLLAAAQDNGIAIPTLCHDERVAPYGACGLCSVEVEGVPRLLRACATEAAEGMTVRTRSPRVCASRKTALELMLSAHRGDCRSPCMLACPAHTDCQGYIKLIANGEYREAVKLMKDAHPLPASIGRICPRPCETECRRALADEPINIAGLKYFAADMDLTNGETYLPETAPGTGYTVAVAGGGPAGLTAAYFLKRGGHHVVVYDSMPKMGGLLRYGIPEYRLPKAVLDMELDLLQRMGIVFQNEMELGRDVKLQFLRNTYNAVIIATGAGSSKKLGCPGEELPEVLGGIDFLRDMALGKPIRLGNRVAVVGGSNTAMDAARTAVRLGVPEVYVLYRRTRDEMPAEPAEVREAEEEGVIFKYLVTPIDITKNAGLRLRLQHMALGEPDTGGRRSPIPLPGAEESMTVDTVIAAIGQDINLAGLESLPVTRRGTLAADNSFFTGIQGVYAIGDATGQSAYAIEAIGHGQKAAAAVHAYLNSEAKTSAEICSLFSLPGITGKEPSLPENIPQVLVKDKKNRSDFINEPRLPRENAAHKSACERKTNFTETSLGFTPEQAVREAARCLACGCGEYFTCKLLRYANEYQADADAYEGCEKPKRPADVSSPALQRNPDKCILCGLCVRVCDEVMGKTALGIMGRGFEAVVAPAFDLPLAETDCHTCGQCAALCPTGALTGRIIAELSQASSVQRTQ
jgi:formate dehydrogenase major subunit